MAFILLLAAALPCMGWFVAARFGGVEAQIDRMFSYGPFVGTPPSATVLVAQDGRVLFSKSYGCKDVETGEKADPQTCYRLGAISTSFTSMAIMLLAERGQLAYDDPAAKYITDWPAYAAKVTIRHLLTHSSGLREYQRYYPIRGEPPLTDRTAVALLHKADGLNFEPGTRYQYVDGNYAALALIVEAASGMSFPDFLQKEIFAPCGMKTAVALVEGINRAPNRAYGSVPANFRYDRIWNENNWVGVSAWNYRKLDQCAYSAVLGDGGVYASACDLLAWDSALREYRLLSPDVYGEAVKPHYRDYLFDSWMGFGWFLNRFKDYGPRMEWLPGASIGFSHAFLRVPERELVVIVLTNNIYMNSVRAAEDILGLYLCREE